MVVRLDQWPAGLGGMLLQCDPRRFLRHPGAVGRQDRRRAAAWTVSPLDPLNPDLRQALCLLERADQRLVCEWAGSPIAGAVASAGGPDQLRPFTMRWTSTTTSEGLINFYSHTLSTGLGDAGALQLDYITYSLNTNLHPRVWSANAASVYQWWLQRSNAQISVSCTADNNQSVTTLLHSRRNAHQYRRGNPHPRLRLGAGAPGASQMAFWRAATVIGPTATWLESGSELLLPRWRSVTCWPRAPG